MDQEQSVEFGDFLKFNLKCLKLAGLDPLKDKNDKSLKSKLMTFYHGFFIASLIAILPMSGMAVIRNSLNIQILTRVIPMFVFSTISLAKFISIAVKREAFITMVEKCQQLFRTNYEEKFKVDVARELRMFKRIEQTCVNIGVCVLSLFLVFIVFRMISTGNWIQKFPIELWYPFDEYDPRVYGFVLLWVVTMTTVFVYALLGIDFLVYGLITTIAIAHYHLCHQLESLHRIPEDKIVPELKRLVRFHQDLIRICNTLEEIFSLSNLINFFGISIIICDVGFQVIDGTNAEYSIKYTGMLCSALSQILMLCFFGTKLMDSSEKISTAVYASGWNEVSNKEAKHLILMITMRSQKPCVLKASKFSTISLKAYGSVSNW